MEEAESLNRETLAIYCRVPGLEPIGESGPTSPSDSADGGVEIPGDKS